jgi:hypothetical protein
MRSPTFPSGSMLESVDWLRREQPVINALNDLLEEFLRSGFWKYSDTLKLKGTPWNHKRIYRVHCNLGFNLPRKAKKRLPGRALSVV